jgi:hypothetical protein
MAARQGKRRRPATTPQSMADSDPTTSIPPEGLPPAGSADADQYIKKVAKRGYAFIAPIRREDAKSGEGDSPLWDGRIIDAILPQL